MCGDQLGEQGPRIIGRPNALFGGGTDHSKPPSNTVWAPIWDSLGWCYREHSQPQFTMISKREREPMLCAGLDSLLKSGVGTRSRPQIEGATVGEGVIHGIPHTEVRDVVKQGLVRGSFNSR